MSFQDAKDTFYVALRDRLAALNPDRTVIVRGAVRPGVLVEENEIADAHAAPTLDAFVLRWTEFNADGSEAVTLKRGRCEIRYATAGMAELAGMDRGRAMQAMDEELLRALQPASATLARFQVGKPPVLGATRVFWSDVALTAGSVQPDRLERVATVDVFAWEESL